MALLEPIEAPDRGELVHPRILPPAYGLRSVAVEVNVDVVVEAGPGAELSLDEEGEHQARDERSGERDRAGSCAASVFVPRATAAVSA